MKRGLIMEVSKRKAVILTKDGSFERVRLKRGEQPKVGQEYICPPEFSDALFRPNRALLPSFSLSLVAIIVFVLVAGGMPFEQNKASAAAYVSFDINPSIEVSVDKEMNVIKVRALNEDAKNLLEGSNDYQDTSLLLFSDFLFKTLKEYGYFDTYDDLLITSSIDDDYASSEISERLENSIEELRTSEHFQDSGVMLSVMETTEANRDLANENGLSMGKYLVFQDVLANGKTLTPRDANSTSYSDLIKLLVTDKTENNPVQKIEKPFEKQRLKEVEPASLKTNEQKSDVAKKLTKPNTSTSEDKDDDIITTVKKGVKDKTPSTAEKTDEDEKVPATTEPADIPGDENAVTAPAKDQVDLEDKNEKKNEDKDKEESQDDSEATNNTDAEDDLQVKIKIDLQGIDKKDLSPQELRLLESLQINIFSGKDNGKSNKHNHHQERHNKHSHGR